MLVFYSSALHASEGKEGKQEMESKGEMAGSALPPTAPLSATPYRPDLSDRGLRDLASRTPGAENVLSLHCQFRRWCKRWDVASGSVTYLGQHVALTDAHCVSMWCDEKGQLKPGYRLVVKNGRQSCRVTDVIIHPAFLENPMISDLAMLRLEHVIGGLKGLKPDYTPLEKQENIQWTTLVGFGHSGGSHDWFSRADGEKRAVRVLTGCIDQTQKESPLIIAYNGGFYVSDEGRQVFRARPLLAHECGSRPGMSGGPVLTSSHRVMALCKGGGQRSDSQTSWLRVKMRYGYFKHLAAFGIYAPCIVQCAGEVSSFTPLAPYKGWIEEHRRLCNKKRR